MTSFHFVFFCSSCCFNFSTCWLNASGSDELFDIPVSCTLITMLCRDRSLSVVSFFLEVTARWNITLGTCETIKKVIYFVIRVGSIQKYANETLNGRSVVIP